MRDAENNFRHSLLSALTTAADANETLGAADIDELAQSISSLVARRIVRELVASGLVERRGNRYALAIRLEA